MSLKLAVIIGLMGAALSLFLNLLPLTYSSDLLDFFYSRPMINILLSLSNASLLVFFSVLLIKQK